jgi:hypothetical protein
VVLIVLIEQIRGINIREDERNPANQNQNQNQLPEHVINDPPEQNIPVENAIIPIPSANNNLNNQHKNVDDDDANDPDFDPPLAIENDDSVAL